MGDFNLVEDGLDRLPAHPDDSEAVAALTDLRTFLQLQDGWRTTYPDVKQYTFLQSATGSQSRIDRIYTSSRIQETAENWDMLPPPPSPAQTGTTVQASPMNAAASGLKTDHLMVSTKVVHRQTPYIGPGRWVMPLFLTEDRPFMNAIYKKSTTLSDRIRLLTEGKVSRTSTHNAQTLLEGFKSEVTKLARQQAKVAIPTITREIAELQRSLTDVLNRTDSRDPSPADIKRASSLQEKICDLEAKRYSNAMAATKARYRVQGESFSLKYWSKICKPKTPRNLIYRLSREGPLGQARIEETKSQRMAELARDYHENIQLDTGRNATEKDEATDEILRNVNSRLSEDRASLLSDRISDLDVDEALRASQNGKAAGIDGIPYEFWKAMRAREKAAARRRRGRAHPANGRQRPPAAPLPNSLQTGTSDIYMCLAAAFNDITEHGVLTDSDFTTGWMYPLYKKNDRQDIANYRPITLLNTDYKIFTKVLAMRLALATPSIIHNDQAGFIPGRSITEQVKLVRQMINMADSTDQNGTIIALDQEKAYDRIDHEYLWRTLERFGIPRQFISTVQSLYHNARTVVIINGERSSPYTVTRGVRQGDPMSCLLFNLAIEPLACTLRNSTLRGYSVPGVVDKILVSLFADDTTVFLSEHDDYNLLQRILDLWCTASTAKFNSSKTNIIPIGSHDYRQDVISTRTLQNSTSALDPSIRIAKDGEPTRILGAWLGNMVNDADPWSKVLDRIATSLDMWSKTSPSLVGKARIVQCVVGGGTQYLTTVQGMPLHVEKSVIKLIRSFIWNGAKASTVSMETLFRPITEGGINLLDIKSRNEAILLRWMASYANFSPARAAWGHVADVILHDHVMARDRSVPPEARVNPVIQSWSVSTANPRKHHGQPLLPDDLKQMIKTAKKYNVSVNAVKISECLKLSLPLWYHIGADGGRRRLNNSRPSKCLRMNHGISSVGDAIRVLGREANHTHAPFPGCPCAACTEDREVRGCRDPSRCCEEVHNVLDCLVQKFDPRDNPPQDNLSLEPQRKQRRERNRTWRV